MQSRYYDPIVGRFINADSYVSTGQGLTGYNMFAYCGNNPVNYVDHTGELAIADDLLILAVVGLCTIGMLWLIHDATHEQILVNFVSDVVTQTADALDNIASFFAVDTPQDDANDIIINPPPSEVVFPENPYEFNPVGLVMITEKGTKNGKIIYWKDSSTNKAIFYWHENSTKPNGPHYHVIGDPTHYYPSKNDKVPEPYATIYFPVR